MEIQFLNILKSPSNNTGMIIQSIEALHDITADKSFKRVEIQLENISELDFVECVKDQQVKYKRIGFKKWLLTSNISIQTYDEVKEKQDLIEMKKIIVLRKFILALAVLPIIYFISVGIITKLGGWENIEASAAKYPIIFAVLVSIINFLYKGKLFSFFKEYYNKYIYGTKSRTASHP